MHFIHKVFMIQENAYKPPISPDLFVPTAVLKLTAFSTFAKGHRACPRKRQFRWTHQITVNSTICWSLFLPTSNTSPVIRITGPLWEECSSDRRISLTRGQSWGKCVHVMKSPWKRPPSLRTWRRTDLNVTRHVGELVSQILLFFQKAKTDNSIKISSDTLSLMI